MARLKFAIGSPDCVYRISGRARGLDQDDLVGGRPFVLSCRAQGEPAREPGRLGVGETVDDVPVLDERLVLAAEPLGAAMPFFTRARRGSCRSTGSRAAARSTSIASAYAFLL
ncbi:MAG: hypothetical protein U0599_03945 [Vicinamibacteria bacterium]